MQGPVAASAPLEKLKPDDTPVVTLIRKYGE